MLDTHTHTKHVFEDKISKAWNPFAQIFSFYALTSLPVMCHKESTSKGTQCSKGFWDNVGQTRITANEMNHTTCVLCNLKRTRFTPIACHKKLGLLGLLLHSFKKKNWIHEFTFNKSFKSLWNLQVHLLMAILHLHAYFLYTGGTSLCFAVAV